MSAFQRFSFSAFAFGRICLLESEAALSELAHHACEDREQFIGFAQQLSDRLAWNTTIIPQ
jgi:hypothetical protein